MSSAIALRIAAVALTVAVGPQWACAEERKEIRESVSIDYEIRDPCTNQKVRIVGDIVVRGYYQEVEAGYRLRGEADYSDLTAKALNSQIVYRVRSADDDGLRMTVDVPVERTIAHTATFRSAERAFEARFQFKFSVSFFGDKDVDLVGVRAHCVKAQAASRR